jgi:hypothetical protein
MGSRGPLPKPSERRQRRNASSASNLVVLERVERPVPDAPTGLLKATVTAWTEFWRSSVAGLVEDGDMETVRRLFCLRDERERAYRAFRRSRFVSGSKRQPVLNPLARYMLSLDGEIRQLEAVFGIGPVARLRAGIAFAEATRSLDELNRTLDVEAVELDDPRLEAGSK